MEDRDFEVTEEKASEGVRFTIRGRINATYADELQGILKQALKEGQTNIVLNMFWVDFLSSAGIKVILKTYQDATDAGGKLGIELPSENVRNVLGMLALNEMLIK